MAKQKFLIKDLVFTTEEHEVEYPYYRRFYEVQEDGSQEHGREFIERVDSRTQAVRVYMGYPLRLEVVGNTSSADRWIGGLDYLMGRGAHAATEDEFNKLVARVVEACQPRVDTTLPPIMNQYHDLKIDSDVFEEVFRGRKACEIRYNDRDFKAGDVLRLRETRYSSTDMKERPEECPLEYTGRNVMRKVTHVLDGGALGLLPNWVVLSLEII